MLDDAFFETFRDSLDTALGGNSELTIREIEEKLAAETGAAFIDLNECITDTEGELKAEYTIDGMHMYADGYMQVMKALIPYLPQC